MGWFTCSHFFAYPLAFTPLPVGKTGFPIKEADFAIEVIRVPIEG
jgi:hypothetical protein